MLRTLYGKLAVALTALVAALLVAQVIVSMRAAQAYEEETTQRVYRDLAATLLADEVNPRWGLPVLTSEFETLMHLNPLIEFYYIDTEGVLMAHAAPEGRVVVDRVDMQPVHALLAGDEMLPIRGDDPRDPSRRKIFSVAEVYDGDRLRGYLYVILQGEQYESAMELLGSSAIAQLAVGSLALVSVFALVVGLVLFRSITRRVAELDRAMSRFQADGASEVAVAGRDELDRLRETFDHLAARVTGQVSDLEEVDRLRRELVASVSHDLRTPLAALRGYLETLQLMGDTLEPDDQKRYLEAASRHTERLASLVDDLFELAKLESGVVQPRIETFHLDELAQDVLQPFELRAKDAGIELRGGFGGGVPPVRGDIGLIERVLENLLENALRHTPEGGTVEVSVRPIDGDVELSVADDGEGIPAEALPRVFERFYRVADAERGDGMGLGLATVQRILELHGREVGVESRPGQGTRFHFRLECA